MQCRLTYLLSAKLSQGPGLVNGAQGCGGMQEDGININLCLNRVFLHRMQIFINAIRYDYFHEYRWALSLPSPGAASGAGGKAEKLSGQARSQKSGGKEL